MFFCARCLIYFGFAVCTLMMVTGAIWGFGAGYWIAGIIFSCMTLFIIGYFCCIRLRIKLGALDNRNYSWWQLTQTVCVQPRR